MQCPICNSLKVIKRGKDKKRQNSQRFSCNTCGYCWRVFDKTIRRQRVLLFSDFHCGHVTGLTPEQYNDPTKEYSNFRKESWTWFKNVIELMKPFDYLVANGDLIDGKQSKQGGLDLLTTDRVIQAKMAADVINFVGAYKKLIIRGTKYHVGKEENFEDMIASLCNCEIYDSRYVEIAGKVFDLKHKIGRSGTPYGRLTPLSKQITWNRLKTEKDVNVSADVIVRSHVHYHVCIEESGKLAMTLPALQGKTAYGSQECDGEIDYGLIVLDLEPDGRIVKHTFLPVIDSMKEKILIL